MKVFQIVHKYDPYISYFEEKYHLKEIETSFRDLIKLLINDGFMSCHLLKSVIENQEDSFYTIWDYERLQLQWAKENDCKTTDLFEILKAQINQSSSDVIYNMSPQKISIDLFKNLKKEMKLICWNADAGTIENKYQDYDALLTSSVIKRNNSNNAYLHYPSQDFLMKEFSPVKKEIDVLFYGQYAPGIFEERKEYIDQLIPFLKAKNISFKFSIMYNTWKEPLINRRYLWKIPFLQKELPSKSTKENFDAPIFGKDIYDYVSKSKIIFNVSGGLKQFGAYKFNMRIFETLGVGSFMLSDDGIYPEYLEEKKDFDTYKNIDDLKNKIIFYLKEEKQREEIAQRGKEKIEQYYSKENQWNNFKSIVEKL